MRQKTGECYVLLEGEEGQHVRVPKPKKFYIRPPQLLRFTQLLSRQHALPADEVDRLIKERQAKLLAEAQASANGSTAEKPKRKKRSKPKDDEPNPWEGDLNKSK